MTLATISGRPPVVRLELQERLATTISFFAGRVTANPPLEHRLRAVTNTVRHVLRVVPIFNAKVCIPARVAHLRFPSLDPLAIPLELQPGQALLARLEREKLSRYFQHAGLMGVDRKRHNLVTRHIHRRRSRLTPPALELGFRASALRPPFAGGQRVELGKLRAERLSRFTSCKKFRSKGQRAHPGGGDLNGGASIHFHGLTKIWNRLL